MKFSIWSDEEVKSLFAVVEKAKLSNQPLKEAFLEHAKIYHRKGNSVRNYYYHEVDNLSKDSKRCQRLKIDLSKHIKNKLIPFSKEQEEKFLSEINALTSQGMSVRSACYKLSGGDMTLMTRLQNKFQNLKNQKPNNLVIFRQKQKVLSDNDINSLFMGLMKLIKKNTTEEVMDKMKSEKETAEYLLKQAYGDINKKEKELARLKEEYALIKAENSKLQQEMIAIASKKQEKLKEKLSGTKRLANLKV